MAVTVTCAGCGEAFEARRTTARWCSDRCRKRRSRSKSPTPLADAVAEVADRLEGNPLVASVRAELERAGVVDTFAGQLAITLATRLSTPDESGASSLSKELRTVMAAALDGVTPPAPAETDDAVEDEITRARDARERKAREAARRA